MYSKEICRLCGGSNIKLLYSKAEFNILRCGNCGFVFNERWEEFSDEVNIAAKEKFDTNTMATMATTYEKEKLLYFDRFSKELETIKKIKKGGRILDIGCGYGHFLILARQEGFEVHGINVNKQEINFCKQYLKLNIHHGSLVKSAYPHDHFDVITLFHVLEHIPDFDKTISIFEQILKPDGLIVIDVPNIDDMRRVLLKQKWPMFKKHHLWYFSLTTLKFLMRKYGFEIFQVRLHGGSNIIYFLNKKLKKYATNIIARQYHFLRPFKNCLSSVLNKIGFSEEIEVYAKKVAFKKAAKS